MLKLRKAVVFSSMIVLGLPSSAEASERKTRENEPPATVYEGTKRLANVDACQAAFSLTLNYKPPSIINSMANKHLQINQQPGKSYFLNNPQGQTGGVDFKQEASEVLSFLGTASCIADKIYYSENINSIQCLLKCRPDVAYEVDGNTHTLTKNITLIYTADKYNYSLPFIIELVPGTSAQLRK